MTSTKTAQEQKFPIVVDDRESDGIFVAMLYHGKDAENKLSITVQDTKKNETFVLFPDPDKNHDALDMFYHPFAYQDQAA
jgi:hypothetical protein